MKVAVAKQYLRVLAAGTCFLNALKFTRQRKLRALELRATISLVRLWQTERAQEACELLKTTCAWFIEGLDTPDWQTAQALIQQLAE